MNGLFAFIEQMEAHSQEAKALVIPLLENLDSELPWTSSNFWALYQMRHQHDPVIQQALEHLRQYAIPLLEYEEQLADLDLETFTEKMAQIEQRFWEECYTQARVLSNETEASLFLPQFGKATSHIPPSCANRRRQAGLCSISLKRP